MARGDLTDEEWSLVEPHLPPGSAPELRRQFNAVMWRFRTGCPWRDLPEEYGPWPTVYDAFRSWAAAGVFERLTRAVRGQALDGELARALEVAADEERAAASTRRRG